MFAIAGFLLATALSQGATAKLTICIDPGHPSEVGRGTKGKTVSEMHISWEVAKRLQKLLIAKKFRVVMTKSSEGQYVKNRERANIANNSHAALMVRLHCDAASGSGFTTYFPDRQGTAEGFTGPNKGLLKTIKPLAQRFHDQLSNELHGFLKDNGNLADVKTAVGSKHGALVGSIFAKVPVVLVEMCVLTNPQDESRVNTSAGLDRLANGLAKACTKCLSNGTSHPFP